MLQGFRVFFLSLTLFLAGCGGRGPLLPSYLPLDTSPLELTQTPFFPQARYQCGPAALAMVLQASGLDIQPEELVSKVYVPGLKGSLQAEIVATVRDYGRLPYVIEPQFKALLAELRAGRPVLVMQNLGWRFYPLWHYAVAIGYLPDEDKMILRSGITQRKLISVADFLEGWSKAEHWAMVLISPGELPASGEPKRYLAAAVGLEETGRIHAAQVAYRAVVAHWPDNRIAWLGLGNTYYAQGDLAAAEQAYRQLLAREAGNVMARNNLAQVLAERGRIQAALREIERAIAATAVESAPREILIMTRAGIEARVQPRPESPREWQEPRETLQ